MKVLKLRIHLLFVIVVLLFTVIPTATNAGWFGFINSPKKAEVDSELKTFLNFYDSQLKHQKDFVKYKTLFVSAYGLLVDNYVYELDESKRKELLQHTKEKMLQKENTLTQKKVPITAKALTYTALYNLYNDLDPHTSWLNPEESSMLKNSIDGEYQGVGIVLGVEKGAKYVKVLSVIEGGPAAKVGVKEGDLIYKIDGKKYNAKQLDVVASTLKGKDKSKVLLTVLRNKKVKKFTIKRGKVNLTTVYSEKLNNKYAYIKVITFNYNTTAEFRKAVRDLDINKTKGIILDLRGDPGGLLYSSLIIADMFIDKGLLLSVKGRDSSLDTNYYATSQTGVDSNIPVVILVNNMTASASEIVSAALQQNNRAIVMGQPSFGKGSVQTIYNLDDGSSAKITIQLFYTPNGDALQGVGVVPDILVNPVKKTPFYDIRENSYNNRLIVSHLKASNKPKLTINESSCKPYTKVKDKEIGCAVDYFEGKFKLKQ